MLNEMNVARTYWDMGVYVGRSSLLGPLTGAELDFFRSRNSMSGEDMVGEQSGRGGGSVEEALYRHESASKGRTVSDIYINPTEGAEASPASELHGWVVISQGWDGQGVSGSASWQGSVRDSENVLQPAHLCPQLATPSTGHGPPTPRGTLSGPICYDCVCALRTHLRGRLFPADLASARTSHFRGNI